MSKPILDEQFSDNGGHSHWHLTNEYGQVLWSSFPEETRARGQKIQSEEFRVITDQDKQLSLLRGENQKLAGMKKVVEEQLEACLQDCNTAQQENAKLREALEKICVNSKANGDGESFLTALKEAESLLTNNK